MDNNKINFESSIVIFSLSMMIFVMLFGIRLMVYVIINDKSLIPFLFLLCIIFQMIIAIRQLIYLIVYLNSDSINKKLIIKALASKVGYKYQDIKEIRIFSPIIAYNPGKIKIYFKNNATKNYYFQSNSSNLDNIQLLLNILNISYSLRTVLLII